MSNILTDEHIRSDAIKIDQSFIVQAPAGSGKTSLLVKRILNLLTICSNPEECLAITFTKKAAFEMRYRVLQAIEQQIATKTYNATSYAMYHKILANPNRLKILTIDALCAELTKKMPILSKLGVDLTINEDPKGLYLEAIDRLLTSLYNGENQHQYNYLIKFLEYLANDHEIIKNLLINMLAKREQWLPLIMPLKFNKKLNLQAILENNLCIAIEDRLTDLLCHLPNKIIQNKILNLAKYAANNIHDQNNNIIYAKNLTDGWPAARIVDLPMWRALSELLLSKHGQVRRQVNANQGFLAATSIKNPEHKKLAIALKQEMQEILKDLEQHTGIFLAKLTQISKLPDLHYAAENWEVLQGLFALLPELVAHLMIVFQETQQVDFSQVAVAALQAMGTDQEPTDLGLFMDHRINHILVDEFQDTSILQFNLLKKLVANWQINDGRTVFIVGDPMQSIYRFRQAEVGLFLKVQQYGVGHLMLKNLSLVTNFRSSNTIVTTLNMLFAKIFPASNDVTLGGVCYNKAIANNTVDISKVQFFLADNSEAEAENIIDLIKKTWQTEPKQSIAILVRAKIHAHYIIKKLRQYEIKFQANNIEQLANKEIIGDLIALTRAVLHTHDLIAWLALLRGPLVGLKLADLHALSEYDKVLQPWFKQLQEYKNNKNLSKDAVLRLDYVLPILLNAIQNRETLNLSKLIKNTWLSLGGYVCVSSTGIELIEDFFHKLLKINHASDLDALEKLMQEQFVDLQSAQIDLESIQIMTIHKAKGLEFDTVIVPGMTKKPPSLKQQLLLWEERTTMSLSNVMPSSYLLFAPIKSANQQHSAIYDYMKHSEEQRALYEAQRLLYVAMTRARTNFYGFGCKIAMRNNNSFFKFLEPHVVFESYVVPENLDINTISSQEVPVNLKSKLLRRIPSKWYMDRVK